MTSNIDKIIEIFKMTGCTVLGCRSNNNKKLRRNNGPGSVKVNFHRFPKNKSMRELWIKQCGRKYNFNIIHAKICSEHFRTDCYERNLQHELLSITPKCKKLKPDAVPTEKLPDKARIKQKPINNNLGKRICQRRNATETKIFEDENSQPDQNKIVPVRQVNVKEEKSYYHPILPKPASKPIKLVFVNSAPQPPSVAATIPPIVANNDYSQILRSTLMLPPGTTIKQIPNTPSSSEIQAEPNTQPKQAQNSKDDEGSSDGESTPRSGALYYQISKHKKMNLSVNRERLEMEKNRQKFHELIADKIFAMLVTRDNASRDSNNFSYCNIKQEI